MSRRHRWFSIAGVVLTTVAIGVHAAQAEDFLKERWYRMEVILFERGAADATVRRLTEPDAYPFAIMPLTNSMPDPGTAPFAPPPVVRQADAPFFSDRPPPLWLAGDCVAASWAPPEDWADRADALPHDPCLPPPVPAPVPDAPAAPAAQDIDEDPGAKLAPQPTPRQLAAQALDEALAAYERTLFETSYRWQPGAPGFRNERRRLASRFNVLAAGTWHQALPPRDRPQPLLVQIGEPNGAGRFDIEGWFAVTVGRYVHFRVDLMVALDGNAFALVRESRRLRSGEVHYLDHPMLGILVRTSPLEIPRTLREQAEQLDAFDR